MRPFSAAGQNRRIVLVPCRARRPIDCIRSYYLFTIGIFRYAFPMIARSASVIPLERIASRIYICRGAKVMLDSDLAELYGVTTGALNQAVKRNISRFPADFMFQLSDSELENLKSQIVISSHGGRRHNPHAFLEPGIAMLSSVLKSERAAQANVAIMRTFIRLRNILATNKDLARKVTEHDRDIKTLFEAVEQLLRLPEPKKNPIGYIYPKD